MNSIPQNVRYLPHDLNTKFYAVSMYRNGAPASFVCRKYHISKSSLSRWNRKFDGTKESLNLINLYLNILMLILMLKSNGFIII